MYFDHRDVAAETKPWYKSIDSKRMMVIVEIACIDDYCNVEDWAKECYPSLSQKAISLIDEDGCVAVPIEFVVCSTCNGTGTHVNPSIDAHGITAEEWDRDWDYEDREAYMRGMYDVPCYECQGERVVPEIKTKDIPEEMSELIEIIENNRIEESSYIHTCMMERAMGA